MASPQVEKICPPLPLAARHPGMSKAERPETKPGLGQLAFGKTQRQTI